MPAKSSNPLAEFLSGLKESERDLVTFTLGQQVEGVRALSDTEQQDQLEARILRETEEPSKR